MRAGSITNLGSPATITSSSSVEMYKRYYFVDWVVLNDHRQKIKDRIAIVADGQWKSDISWTLFSSIAVGLNAAAHNVFRVRPWFEAGAWGGQWMKEHIQSLPQDEINYAWSFELIVPENGLVFEGDGNLLELSFDWLMEQDAEAILGKDAARFGTEFPIRFDFLDTFDGGNLSIQCHPSLSYIQENFGERITQDETYYILDCKEGAGVWLGFQEDIDPAVFRAELENSVEENIPVDMKKYVQLHPANRHDLFLIPNGTVHSAGKDNLVLEISATPYIFTFKMYDWLRLDLNGEPRPINIGHAFHNLDFSRKGDTVQKELISHPSVIEEKDNYRLVHLPTHVEHFYDVHRIEFLEDVNVDTNGKCHVLMLVEGQSVSVHTANGESHRFSYAETFVIPAAAKSYRLINEGNLPVKIIKAFLK
jgi:mannose-6-phosphate isomerase class I